MKDLFSKQSSAYAKFRPVYPEELYAYILSFVKDKNSVWDCATGNGQVARHLALYFEKVFASDISASQLAHAEKAENIEYMRFMAEQTPFGDNQFDLVTVAQALHWFDYQGFFQEVKRVLKPGGAIAVWMYHIPKFRNPLDDQFDFFYRETMKDYWAYERSHVDSFYETIDFPFEDIERKQFAINVRWSRDQFEGFLNSWSSVQKYKELQDKNPVDDFMKTVEEHWSAEEEWAAVFPIALKIGRIGE